MTAPNRRWFRFSLWTMLVAVAVIGVGTAVVVYPALSIRKSRNAFLQRHIEATPLIESVYRHYSATATWPTEESIAADRAVPPDWVYSARTDPSDPHSPPMLALHGPYHSSLVYYFESPQNGDISRRWVDSWEGDKAVFEARQHYAFDLNPPIPSPLVE